jgi:hypothetical protein
MGTSLGVCAGVTERRPVVFVAVTRSEAVGAESGSN